MRNSGVLMPIFSLPSTYGIGCFSKEAYDFVDSLKKSGQSIWQILPLGPTGYGDSPYQSFSTFAGNPYFIDLEMLIQEGLLTEQECESEFWGDDPKRVDYDVLYRNRFSVLRKAFFRFTPDEGYERFLQENEQWLGDYCLYMAIKDREGGSSWTSWPDALRDRDPKALEEAREQLTMEIDFYRFQQYEFDRQWNRLREYAHQNGISIMGDLPIYVALDSADVWSHPELFWLDEERKPVEVAGCPPDSFYVTGQRWGNPLYDWDCHKQTGYEWWGRRLSHSFQLFDTVRFDHFRGFEAYYAIPFEDRTAENGHWIPGPGMDFFQAMEDQLGKLDIVAEDLGLITESVRTLLRDTGFPGMKLIQFAFDSRDFMEYLPDQYPTHCVAYTGTHDNPTIQGWLKDLDEKCLSYIREYLHKDEKEELTGWDFIELAMDSPAERCVIPMPDFLGLDGEGRINTPATVGDNWVWRMTADQFDDDVIKKIRHVTEATKRIPS